MTFADTAAGPTTIWTTWALRVASALTVSGASAAVGVSSSGTFIEPARSEAARPSGKFSPDASTTVDEPPGKLAIAARRAVSYRFAPPMRLVVTAPAGDA